MIRPKQIFLGCSFKKRTSSYIHLARDVAQQFDVHLVFGDNNARAANIRDQAFKLIAQSRMIILDITPDNVNVGVEYGYSQGVGKRNTYLLVHKGMFEQVNLPAMYSGLQYKTYRTLGGFGDRIEELLALHYRRSFSFIEPDDETADQWLQGEIQNLIDDLHRSSRKEIADALNCAPPDITRAATPLVQRGLLGREANGPDPIYFKLPHDALQTT